MFCLSCVDCFVLCVFMLCPSMCMLCVLIGDHCVFVGDCCVLCEVCCVLGVNRMCAMCFVLFVVSLLHVSDRTLSVS